LCAAERVYLPPVRSEPGTPTAPTAAGQKI
jgi:hypothetical protein